MKVNELMSTNVITVKKDTTVQEIAHLLADNNISGLPVVDNDNKVLGIVTQKDILCKDIQPRFPAVFELLGGIIFVKGVKHFNDELKKLAATKAEDMMTEKVITTTGDTEVEKVAEMMVEEDLNSIPVVDGSKKLVGIISQADLVKYIAKMLD
ncbi:MAG: CBS domain-containing protein [Clostridia bacterium]|nr:CBS domain-containing protein [Clostridia bacterium]